MLPTKIPDKKDRIETWFALGAFCILAVRMFLNAGLEYSRSDLIFEQPRLRDNFTFGMLYWNIRCYVILECVIR